jgi:hypothetical protein
MGAGTAPVGHPSRLALKKGEHLRMTTVCVAGKKRKRRLPFPATAFRFSRFA